VEVPGIAVRNWHDVPRLRLRIGQAHGANDGRPRRTQLHPGAIRAYAAELPARADGQSYRGSRFDFATEYQPTGAILQQQAPEEPYPLEDVDYTHRGAYSQYNWERFFHVPMLIAKRLADNQRFDEALRWFHS
jgi:hypothetical protein